MRVGINARLLYRARPRGWSRCTVNLIRALGELGVELCLYTDRPIAPQHLGFFIPGTFRVRSSPPMSYMLWEQRWLPSTLAADRVAVYHSPFDFGLPVVGRFPCVLTLHDAIGHMPGTDSSLQRWVNPGRLKSAAFAWVARKRADRILTPSEYSGECLQRYLGVPKQRLRVVPFAAAARFHDGVSPHERRRVRAEYHIEGRFIFYVGGWEERKNLPFLLNAFASTKPATTRLVLAGGKKSEHSRMMEAARALGIERRVHLLDFVPDEDLPALYAEALCFVCPSRQEGFGLTLCEAMACGCPTFASDVSSLPEVLGAGGECFPLDDVGPLTALLERVDQDEGWRASLGERALARARSFSWRRTADLTLEVYREVVEQRGKVGFFPGRAASSVG